MHMHTLMHPTGRFAYLHAPFMCKLACSTEAVHLTGADCILCNASLFHTQPVSTPTSGILLLLEYAAGPTSDINAAGVSDHIPDVREIVSISFPGVPNLKIT